LRRHRHRNSNNGCHTTDGRLVDHDVDGFIHIYLGVMKCEIVEGIWDETECRSPYHVPFDKCARPDGPLGHRVALDPPDRDPDVDALHLLLYVNKF
jgi:hypothetical protein